MLEQYSNKEKLEKLLQKSKELAIMNESLDRDTNTLLEELNVSPQQLTSFIEDQSNFTEDNWEELQRERDKLEKKLQTELENISNPTKTKQVYSERQHIDHRWIYAK